MRLLAITALFPPYHLGGYDLRCQEVLGHLQQRGHEVCVITSNYGITKPTANSQVLRKLHLEPSRNLAERILWDIEDLRLIKGQLASFRPDIVYLWHTAQLARTLLSFLARQEVPIMYDEGGVGLLLAWTRRGGWLSFCEGRQANGLKRVARRLVCSAAVAVSGGTLPTRWIWPDRMWIYFNSQFTLERHRAAGIPLSRARVIYSGIDLKQFPYLARNAQRQPVRMLVPARVHPEKGIEDAINALHLLNSRLGAGTSVQLDIAGPIQDAAFHQRLVQRIQELGLTGQVSFRGGIPRSELARAYHESDICLLLTRIPESLSRVPLEAMATGSALITTATGGVAEIVRDRENGRIVPVHSPEAVAEAAAALIGDQEERQRMTRQARHDVESRFDINRAVDEIEGVLKEAAGSDPSDRAGSSH